jgi:hypothetical protein
MCGRGTCIQRIGKCLALIFLPFVMIFDAVFTPLSALPLHLFRLLSGHPSGLMQFFFEFLIIIYRVLFFTPLAFTYAWRSEWYILLGHFATYAPRLPFFLYLLPLWSSKTAKMRAFAEGGHEWAVSLLLGQCHCCCCFSCCGKQNYSKLLVQSVDADRGGAANDDACNTSIIKYLKRGADANATDAKGMSALHMMCVKSFPRSVQSLLRGGADPNLVSAFDGANALHAALDPALNQDFKCQGKSLDLRCSGANRIETVKVLISDDRLNRNATNYYKKTPYMIAAEAEGQWAASKYKDLHHILVPHPSYSEVVAVLGGREPILSLMNLLHQSRTNNVIDQENDTIEVHILNSTNEDHFGGKKQNDKRSVSVGKNQKQLDLPLNSFQLRDMLWAKALEPDDQKRMDRRSLVVAKIITPLINKANTAVLTKNERALLIHACEATASIGAGKTARWKVLVRCWVSGHHGSYCNGVFMRLYDQNGQLLTFHEKSIYQNDDGAVIFFDLCWKMCDKIVDTTDTDQKKKQENTVEMKKDKENAPPSGADNESLLLKLKSGGNKTWIYSMEGSRHPTPPSGRWTHRTNKSMTINVVSAQRTYNIKCDSNNVKIGDRVVGTSIYLTAAQKEKKGLSKSCRGTVVGYYNNKESSIVGSMPLNTSKPSISVRFDDFPEQEPEIFVDKKQNKNIVDTTLSHLYEAKNGESADQDPRGDNRYGHRKEFDQLLFKTMNEFSNQLELKYKEMQAHASGPKLMSVPVSQIFTDTGETLCTAMLLQQNSQAVSGSPPWLNTNGDDTHPDGDLAGAFKLTLKPSGVLESVNDFCNLIQRGANSMFASQHPKNFNRQASILNFWLSLLTMSTVKHHETLNDEVQEYMSTLPKRFMKDNITQKLVYYKRAPLKRYERIRQKALEYFFELKLKRTVGGMANAVGRVVDIIRCSFVVPTAYEMMQLYNFFCAATLQEDGVQALRCKNEHNPNAHSTGGGYRDMKFNLLYQSKKIQGKTGRTIIEVQIILKSFLEVKKKMHAVYRIDRGDFG